MIKPDGTPRSGYVPPSLGPFHCGNCIHFRAPNKCDEPHVVSDPMVRGIVDVDGCCNFFHHLNKPEIGSTAPL